MCVIVTNMYIVIFLALTGSALGAVPMIGNRIIGGSETTVEKYPYMVNMQYGYSGSEFLQTCAGSLITENSVLSAAHCYNTRPTPWWRACLSTTSRYECVISHTLSTVIMHAKFNATSLNNDIAIARLRIPASPTIKLARIAGPNYILPDGTPVTALGWGLTEDDLPSEQLRHVVVNTINQQLCVERYDYLRSQPDYDHWSGVKGGMICVGILNVGGKDACSGDSGGPVIHNGNVVMGITSWGYKCAHSFYPGVAVRVSYYSDWIVRNT